MDGRGRFADDSLGHRNRPPLFGSWRMDEQGSRGFLGLATSPPNNNLPFKHEGNDL